MQTTKNNARQEVQEIVARLRPIRTEAMTLPAYIAARRSAVLMDDPEGNFTKGADGTAVLVRAAELMLRVLENHVYSQELIMATFLTAVFESMPADAIVPSAKQGELGNLIRKLSDSNIRELLLVVDSGRLPSMIKVIMDIRGMSGEQILSLYPKLSAEVKTPD